MATLAKRGINAVPITVRRWTQLMGGLFGCALAIVLMIRSRLGLGPWDALHVGFHHLTGLTIGVISILIGVVILCGTWFMQVRPGVGTVVNMVMIGVFIDLLLPVIPEAGQVSWVFGYYTLGILTFGFATGLYLAAGMGSGPRDGLMIALSERTGAPVRRVRTLVELAVLGAGWAMGGRVGFGTVLFALTVGPAMQWGMQVNGLLPRKASPLRRSRSPQPSPSQAPDRRVV